MDIKEREMTTKQYLEQIGRLNEQIKNKLEEIHNLRIMIGGISGINDSEKVQSSSDKDKVGTLIAKIVDMEIEVDKMVDKRWNIVNQIECIEETESYDVLAKVYILGKDFKEVAIDKGISYRHFLRLHDKAIVEFETLYGANYL